MKYLYLLFFVFLGCENNNVIINEYMLQNYNDINYKKVMYNNDTFIKVNNVKNKNKHNKKLFFLGNMNCSPCVIKLKEIQNYVNSNNYLKNKVDIIYLGLGELTDYFKYQIKENTFSFTIYADTNSVFVEKNKLYEYTHSTFLLNSKNEIILAGNLLKNKQLQSFYKELILK